MRRGLAYVELAEKARRLSKETDSLIQCQPCRVMVSAAVSPGLGLGLIDVSTRWPWLTKARRAELAVVRFVRLERRWERVLR